MDTARTTAAVDPASIAGLFKGIVSVREENGFIMPLRLTEKQLERYKGIPRCCYPYATAGIKLDFITDADEIGFIYHTVNFWDWWEKGQPSFDIYENGRFAAFVPLVRAEQAPEAVHYTCKTPGPRRITIYFPHNAEVKIGAPSFGRATPAPVSDRKFLILGDSISQGLMGNSASFCYTAELERFFDAELLNMSVGGDCFDQTALDPELPYRPTDVIVALGSNDVFFLKDLELITANMKEYLGAVKELYGYANITVITPPYLTNCDTDGAEQYAMNLIFSKEILAEGKRLGLRTVYGDDLVPHHTRFFSDTAHPNDLGFGQYALHLIKCLLR